MVMKSTDKAALTELGIEIRRRRTSIGMTQDDLAKVTGVTSNYLGNIENGQRDPGTLTLLKISKGLGCHVGQLFGERPGAGGLSAEATEAGEAIDGLDSVARRHALGVLRALLA